MVDLSSWCILCGKDSPDGIAIKILPKTLMTTIYGFAKNRYTTKGTPKRICMNCYTFISFYEKQKEHYCKVQEMFTYALKKHRKPQELIGLRAKFNVSDELQDWKSLGFVDFEIKLERLDNSLFQSVSVDECFPNLETELIVKAEPMSPRPASPEIIPFVPEFSPESALPKNFGNYRPSSPDGDSDSGGLSDHFEFTGPDESDHCSICLTKFSSKSSAREHERTHVDNKNLQCSICSKRWSTAENLKRHMKRHNSVACVCDICGIKVVSAKQLKAHTDTVHGGIIEQTCFACGKEFSRSKGYKVHLIAIHTDLRPYICRYCDRTFNNGANFATHKRESHPEEFAEEKKSVDLKATSLPSMAELLAKAKAFEKKKRRLARKS